MKSRIDWVTTVIPCAAIILLCVLFMVWPEQSSDTLESVRFFFGDQLGSYYLVVGLGVFFISLYIAFSRYGTIRLGNTEKPAYSDFQWGSMMFTAGLAADILFYSLCEWILYANEPHISDMGTIQDWASTYPLFHWGPIPWAFYLVLAVAFGFMLHVRKRTKQKYSEACRPLLGKKTDGAAGKIIDLIAVFALVAGTATTFSVSSPLLSIIFSQFLGIEESKLLTIAILVVVGVIYIITVYFGMKGIARLAAGCVYFFFRLLFLYVFIGGGKAQYIIETGITSLGNMVQNFIAMSTWTDALRTSSFPQNLTIFYWAYWMVWCVAAPFFIGTISKGRTIKQTILGGYFYGLGSFCFLYCAWQLRPWASDAWPAGRSLGIYEQSQNLCTAILVVMDTLPLPAIGLFLLAITMITFYSTSYDALALVAASYSYKELPDGQEPSKAVKLFWAVLLILFPIALVFSDNSMANLQTVSIIAAFPVGIIIVMMIYSFFKDAKEYLNELNKK